MKDNNGLRFYWTGGRSACRWIIAEGLDKQDQMKRPSFFLLARKCAPAPRRDNRALAGAKVFLPVDYRAVPLNALPFPFSSGTGLPQCMNPEKYREAPTEISRQSETLGRLFLDFPQGFPKDFFAIENGKEGGPTECATRVTQPNTFQEPPSGEDAETPPGGNAPTPLFFPHRQCTTNRASCQYQDQSRRWCLFFSASLALCRAFSLAIRYCSCTDAPLLRKHWRPVPL